MYVHLYKCSTCTHLYTVDHSPLLEVLSALGFQDTTLCVLFLSLLCSGFSPRPLFSLAFSLGELNQPRGSNHLYAEKFYNLSSVWTSSELKTPAFNFLLTSARKCLADNTNLTNMPNARPPVIPTPHTLLTFSLIQEKATSFSRLLRPSPLTSCFLSHPVHPQIILALPSKYL